MNISIPRSLTNWLKSAPITLAFGDALVFIFFAVEGRATHDMPLGPSPVITVLAVAAPFAVPWFILAGLLGLFRAETIAHLGRTLFWTTIAWPSAGSVGLVTRAMLLQRPLLPAFAEAALGINGAMLLGWHLIISLAAAQGKLRAPSQNSTHQDNPNAKQDP
jgi:hypothetical protein